MRISKRCGLLLQIQKISGSQSSNWSAAIKDQNLSADSRRELIEDLNQDGFDNLKNFSAKDVQLIQNRLALIKNSRDTSDPKIITEAFNEAEKDLKDMLTKATQRPAQ